MNYKITFVFVCLLLPAMGWGQSEVTHRVSAADRGYLGPVQTVQCTQLSRRDGQLAMVTTTEVYNKAGMRIAMSTGTLREQTKERYDYDDRGRLMLFVFTNSLCVDSVVFRYDSHDCLSGFREYLLYKNGEDDLVINNLVTCDDHCRLLVQAGEWGDSTVYSYDTWGRPVYKSIPGAEDRFFYNSSGRLERVRTGEEHYIDFHIRYDGQGDTLETWYTDWETGGKEPSANWEHKRYKYSRYDDHGNWTSATVAIMESGRKVEATLVRTFTYYK